MSDPKPTGGLKLGRLILTAVLTIGLVALLLTQVSIEKIANMIRGADPGLLMLATAAYALSYVGRTWRWKLLTPGHELGWGPLIGISTVHNFMLRALPSKIGEASYLVLMRGRGVPGTEALAALVVARIYDTIAAIIFFGVSVLLTHTALAGSRTAAGIVILLILAGAAFAVLKGSLMVKWMRMLAH
ncbi:MAG TPA: lysylphosphatidylglycerol synthase transmembrane domain-containing protein, partial [Candidatus Eisenbacteria bacterium]